MKTPKLIQDFTNSIGNVNRYSLLGRLQRDCECFLGYGNRNERRLWGLNVNDHIKYMKYLYLLFPINEKPQWLTMADILRYESEMNK